MGGPFYIASGNLAFGPSGNLYFDYSTDNVNGTNPSLYTVNTSTGALTAVGSGLGSPFLTLFSVGSTLYGIDTIATSNIGIYTINTTTGIATPTGVIVIGLPSGYTLDTATSISPCPQPQGYWKNNPDAWPVSALPMTLGSQTYTQAELLTILRTPTGKGTKADASLILADQLIAAKLNIANGADGTPVTSTIADADAVLSLYTGKLPYRVRTNTTNGRRMVNDAATLESYNNGLLTPGCGG